MENCKQIAKGVGIALITTFIVLLVFSAILTYSNINEIIINPTIMIISGISFLGNKHIRKNGMLNRRISWYNLYINFIYNLKYIKLEVQSNRSINYHDVNRNHMWYSWWNLRCKYTKKITLQKTLRKGFHCLTLRVIFFF